MTAIAITPEPTIRSVPSATVASAAPASARATRNRPRLLRALLFKLALGLAQPRPATFAGAQLLRQLVAARVAIGGIEAVEVHLADSVHNEPREVACWQPLPDIRRHQKRLLAITRDKALAHHRTVLNPPDDTPTYATASPPGSSG